MSISKGTFETYANDCSVLNIITINSGTTGDTLLAPVVNNIGTGISPSEEEDIIDYMDNNSESTLRSSNLNLLWLVASRKDPC